LSALAAVHPAAPETAATANDAPPPDSAARN
jgi:hypothetical protein